MESSSRYQKTTPELKDVCQWNILSDELKHSALESKHTDLTRKVASEIPLDDFDNETTKKCLAASCPTGQ